jgi:proteasome accessory factor C
MADGPTAEARLTRILQLLPLATRTDGATLGELAARLGVSEREVVRDLEEVIGRSYYRPAGDTDDVTVMIEPDRVEVWTTGQFRRPMRLTPREGLALGLGLRMLAALAGPGGDGKRYRALAAALEQRLVVPRVAAGAGESRPNRPALPSTPTRGTPSASAPDPDAQSIVEINPGVRAPGAIHATLSEAARERRRCRILYLRSGADQPEGREIDPYTLIVAGGRWYTVGHCHARQGVRVFRMDRLLDATPLDTRFDAPGNFDPRDYVSDGRVYRADEFEEVTIRYSARVARWIAEQGPAEVLPDGSALVRYSVADRRWVVRHVLEHAPEAEVVAPDDLRDLIRRSVTLPSR